MFSLFIKYMKPYLRYVIATLIFTVFEYVLQICFLFPESKRIIDKGVVDRDYSVIWQSGVLMLVLTIIIGICSLIIAYLSAKATACFTAELHNACYKKVNKMSPQDFAVFGESTLVSRTISDVSQIRLMTINLLRTWLVIPVMIILELGMIAYLNIRIFFILFCFFAFTVFIMVFFGAKSKTAFEKVQKKVDHINMLMKEKLVGIRPIRAFGNEEIEDKKLENAYDEAYEYSIQANKKINFLSPIALVIMSWVVVIIYLFGSNEVKTGMASISELLLIFQYVTFFIASLAGIPFMVNIIPKVSVSAKRINELLNYKEIKRDNTEKNEWTVTDGEIEFKNVIFGYSGAVDVIANVSFVAKPKKITAFIGSTGSGKTTIANLIQGLYQPTFGEILIDGKRLKDFSDSALRKTFSYGTQKSMVFQDTIRKNICAENSDISEERLNKALEASCFDEVLRDKNCGLDFMLTQGGMNLSGGQRQRLSLARVMARDVPVYIFDDSFSALDAHTERKALSAMKELLKDKTIIMIAQKISTIMDADNIIVLDGGRIAGQGKHKELLQNCAVYRDIYETQCYLNKEE